MSFSGNLYWEKTKQNKKHQKNLFFTSFRNTTDLCLDSNPLHTFPCNFFVLLRKLQKAIVTDARERGQEQTLQLKHLCFFPSPLLMYPQTMLGPWQGS